MTREEIIARAKVAHDAICHCDSRYLMSCGKMAAAILGVNRDQENALIREAEAGYDVDALQVRRTEEG